MRIAYLITAYNNFNHLNRLIHSLNNIDVKFYIHIDKKSIIPKKGLIQKQNINYINSINVWWGGWSHQQAINDLIYNSMLDKNDYYILITGSDYPIKKHSLLVEKLKQSLEYINIVKGFQSHKPDNRIKYYYLDGFDRRKKKSIRSRFGFKLENILRKIKYEKVFSFGDIYFGTTYWALSHGCISYVINFINSNPDYIKFYKSTLIPEESFIHSIIGPSNFNEKIEHNLTYQDWNLSPHPEIIKMEHYLMFKQKKIFKDSYGEFEPFFARKFEDSSGKLTKLIDLELLNKNYRY